MNGFVTIALLKALYFSKNKTQLVLRQFASFIMSLMLTMKSIYIEMFKMFRRLLKLGSAYCQTLTFQSVKQYEECTDVELEKLIQTNELVRNNMSAIQEFMAKNMPPYDRPTSVKHVWTHSTLKVQRDLTLTQCSELSGHPIKDVRIYYILI